MKKAFTAHEKARIALEAIRGISAPSELSSASGAHPIQIGLWKKQASTRLHMLFDDARTQRHAETQQRRIDELCRIIGQRDFELEWMKKNLQRLDSS